MTCPIAEIQEKNAALLNAAPANDNATNPWAHLNRIMAEYDALIDQTRDMADTMQAMNDDTKRLIAQLIERGRPDFTPMEADRA